MYQINIKDIEPHHKVTIEYNDSAKGSYEMNLASNKFVHVFGAEHRIKFLNTTGHQITGTDLKEFLEDHVKETNFRLSRGISTGMKKIEVDGKLVFESKMLKYGKTLDRNGKNQDTKKRDLMTNDDKILVLDTETTGFKKEDEVLQLTILDGNGKELFNEYFKPEHTQSWESAEKCNHISPSFVADKESLLSQKERIESLLKKGDLIVGYNPGFDIKMLEQNGIEVPKDKKYMDIMIPYAKWKNVPNEYGKPKWFKLKDCAKDYGFLEADFHNSLGDTKATLHCYQEMLKRGLLHEGDIKDPSHLVGYSEKEFRRARGIPAQVNGIKKQKCKSNSSERY